MHNQPMIRLTLSVLTILFVAFTFSTGASAAAFVKYEGIDGESKDANHEGWSDILSVTERISKPASATGQTRRRGAVVFEDILIQMEMDKASIKLREKLARGEVIPKVEIEFTATYGGARATYFKYELKNVLITSYQTNASGNDEAGPPSDQVTLNFEEIKWTYTEFDDTGASQGNVEAEFNVEKGE